MPDMRPLSLVALTVVLTACPATPDAILRVPDDPRVLNGRWQGTLHEAYDIRAFTSGGGQTFELRIWPFSRESTEHPAEPGAHAEVVVRTVSTGVVTRSRFFPGVLDSLAYRTDGRLVLAGATGTTVLDSSTLDVVDKREEVRGQLSDDGEMVVGDALVSTRDWSRSPRAANTPDDRLSSDGRWAFEKGVAKRLSDGLTLHLTPQHPNTCRILSGWVASSVEHLGDRLAVGFVDGYIEIRALDGSLQHVLRATPSCDGVVSALRHRADGRLLAHLSPYGGSALQRVVRLNWASGEVEAHNSLSASDGSAHLSLEGLAFSGWPGFGTWGPLQFASPGAERWSVPRETLSTQLDATASFLSDSMYRASGTLRLASETLTFDITATGVRTTFTKQGRPAPSVRYAGPVNRATGPYGVLTGVHGASGVGQSVQLFRKEDGHTFMGELSRP